MKVRHKPTRAEIEQVAEACSQEMIECLQTENALNILAVIRHFHLGKKRIAEFMKTLEDIKCEFAEYSKDGILVEKTKEELAYYGLDIDMIYEKPESMKECLRKKKAERNHSMSLREMYDVNNSYKNMKEFMESEAKSKTQR